MPSDNIENVNEEETIDWDNIDWDKDFYNLKDEPVEEKPIETKEAVPTIHKNKEEPKIENNVLQEPNKADIIISELEQLTGMSYQQVLDSLRTAKEKTKIEEISEKFDIDEKKAKELFEKEKVLEANTAKLNEYENLKRMESIKTAEYYDIFADQVKDMIKNNNGLHPKAAYDYLVANNLKLIEQRIIEKANNTYSRSPIKTNKTVVKDDGVDKYMTDETIKIAKAWGLDPRESAKFMKQKNENK